MLKKIEKGNKVKDKEGSTGPRNILMKTTKPGKKRKKGNKAIGKKIYI